MSKSNRKILAAQRREREAELTTTEKFLGGGFGGLGQPLADQLFFSPFSLLYRNTKDLLYPYAQHKWVFACIDKRANLFATPAWRIYRGPRDKRVEIPSSPWVPLFEQPNPMLSAKQFFRACAIHLALRGEVFIVLEGENGRVGPDDIPAELWPMCGSLFYPEFDEKTKIPWLWRLNVNGERVDYQPHEIIHVKRYNPDNPWRGLGPMQVALITARTDWKAAQWNEAFFDNGGNPGGLLTTDQELTEEQQENTRASWNRLYGGQTQAHRTAVLQGGLKYVPIGPTHSEMGFKELAEMSRDELIAIFGLSKVLFGLSQQINKATARVERRVVWEMTIIPEMIEFEETLRVELFSRGSKNHWGAFDLSSVDALQEAMEDKINNSIGLRELGYPLNVINRELKLGMPNIEGGDVSLVPSGLVPLETLLAGETEEDPAPEDVPEDEDEPDEEDEPVSDEALAWPPAHLPATLCARTLRKVKRHIYNVRALFLSCAEEMLHDTISIEGWPTVEELDNRFKLTVGPVMREIYRRSGFGGKAGMAFSSIHATMIHQVHQAFSDGGGDLDAVRTVLNYYRKQGTSLLVRVVYHAFGWRRRNHVG